MKQVARQQVTGRIRPSGLLLTELMIAILFFSAASAFCLQLFAKTHTLNRRAAGLEVAVTQGESVVSLLKTTASADDPLQAAYKTLHAVYSSILCTDDTVTLYFDEDGKNCAQGIDSYMLTVRVNEDKTTIEDAYSYIVYDITVTDPTAENESDAALHTLTAAVYHGIGNGEEASADE